MQESSSNVSQTKRRSKLKKSFFYGVLLPFIIGAFYLCFYASDRYVSGAGFAVRSMSGQGGNDLLGSVTGLVGNGSSTSDSYIVIKFLESRDLLQAVLNDADFEEIYGSKDIDFLSRMGENLKIEELLDYWKWYVDSSFDPSSGIIRFEVQAFEPEEAYEVASLILKQVKRLTNELSEQARMDTMYYAQEELDLAEKRLLEARTEVKLFRDTTNSVDLSASAMAQIELLASLEKELIGIKARIEVLKESLDADAPSIKALERKSEALEFQISEKSGGLKITGYSNQMSGLLAKQEKLGAEKTFAETAYASALTSMETARMEASRNQRYLAIYSHPSLPEYPIFPKRLLYIVYLFLGLVVLWGIIVLIAYAIQDHMMAGWIDEDPEGEAEKSFKRKLNKLLKTPRAFFSDSKFPAFRIFKNGFKKK